MIELLNYDIICNILHLLEPTYTTESTCTYPGYLNIVPTREKGSLCDLLSLSRTCRAFSTPALQTIWRIQTSFVPVLKLLPQFQREPDLGDLWVLNGDVAPSDWDRFDYYADMIQEMHVLRRLPKENNSQTHLIHDSVFCYLLQSRTRVLFPDLFVLSMTADIRLPFLYSPSLRRVVLHADIPVPDFDHEIAHIQWNPWASSLMDRLHSSPDLEHVSLKRIMIRPYTLRALFAAPRLQTLEVAVAPSFFLSDLAQIVNTPPTAPQLLFLRELRISCLREPYKTRRSSASMGNRRLSTPKLELLVITAQINYIATLCDIIDCQNLKHCELSVIQNKSISLATQATLHESIASQIVKLSSHNLESLSILPSLNHMFPFQPMKPSHFHPLYKLHRIEKLVLDCIPFIPTDSDLASMGQSWPMLKVLQIPLPRHTARKR
ncbi:hypothetical protein CVT24_011452 [Panaeolus cyanescens]|uniref:F-box domain-containing protein n=1 Tax=Panaeolus cyanescens TaxID=181874 RepID=A0A409VGG6_9AGAR|nr:hypothetical protein CVT24_011452 [Panaeolus cyanescens]